MVIFCFKAESLENILYFSSGTQNRSRLQVYMYHKNHCVIFSAFPWNRERKGHFTRETENPFKDSEVHVLARISTTENRTKPFLFLIKQLVLLCFQK